MNLSPYSLTLFHAPDISLLISECNSLAISELGTINSVLFETKTSDTYSPSTLPPAMVELAMLISLASDLISDLSASDSNSDLTSASDFISDLSASDLISDLSASDLISDLSSAKVEFSTNNDELAIGNDELAIGPHEVSFSSRAIQIPPRLA